MAGQIEIYRKEVFDFLRTVTIKFEPFAKMLGQDYMLEHGETDPNGEWNPYYIHMIGEYVEGETPMEVYSVEEEAMVPFNKELFTKYPKTGALFKIPRNEYNSLVDRYPDNVDLIKSIVYPVADIKTAIEAENLTLLAYDSSLLDTNEKEDLVFRLKQFLNMVRTRWWVPEYQYEDLYARTFWWNLWQHLPLVLLTRRFENIRTPYAHNFHVWEYLKGKGMSDYRDVLTNNQSNWLYRNMEWVEGNVGKNEALTELADNLLEEISVSLNYKDMWQTVNDDLETIPVFKTVGLINGEETDVESVGSFNDRLVESGLESRADAEYVDELEHKLASQPHNHLPTKFLEFKKDPINTANEQLMCNFFINSLAYRLSCGHLGYNVKLVDPYTHATVETFIGDVVLLWSYAMYKSIGQDPIELPRKFISYLAFKKDQVLAKDFTKYIWYGGNRYAVTAFVNTDGIASIMSGDWHPKAFDSGNDWVNTLAEQFRDLLLIQRYYESDNDLRYHLAMNAVLKDIRHIGTVNLNLTSKKTYAEWFTTQPLFAEWCTTYDGLTDPVEQYERLSQACFDVIFPLTEVMKDEFVGTLRNMETIYNSIRDLFIQLCSYNITFLETERSRNYYWNYRDLDFVFPTSVTFNYDKLFQMIIYEYRRSHKIQEQLNTHVIPYDLRNEMVGNTFTFGHRTYVDYHSALNITSSMENKLLTNRVAFNDKKVIVIKFKLHAAIASCRYRG